MNACIFNKEGRLGDFVVIIHRQGFNRETEKLIKLGGEADEASSWLMTELGPAQRGVSSSL